MTKKEIVKTISEEIGLTQLKTKEIVQKTFDAIVDTLVTEKRIELRNFGVFEVKKRAARKARNPRTGERVDVAEKFVVTFKPGKEMEERVRLLEEQAAREAEAARLAALAPPPPATESYKPQPFVTTQLSGISSATNPGFDYRKPNPVTEHPKPQSFGDGFPTNAQSPTASGSATRSTGEEPHGG